MCHQKQLPPENLECDEARQEALVKPSDREKSER